MTRGPRVPGMPVLQKNAHVDDGLLVRVGIPHSGGRLAFHAFNEGYPAMVSASALWNRKTGRFRIPRATDLTEIDFALDSAGFSAMKLFQAKGRQSGIAGVSLDYGAVRRTGILFRGSLGRPAGHVL
ncbi:hypothetical protein LMG28727_06174 [Paraburkholderia kirstenboschensis]|nr:hypothetical protein LMG28727_06174 [Paraburkholderia kirstenboschensis]